MRDKKKEKKKRESAMTHDSTASITRQRKRSNKKRKRLESERLRFCFGLAHSFYLFIYLMKVYLSHLDVVSAQEFILYVNYYFISCWFFCFLFLRKSWWFVLTKMEILFSFSLFILCLFFLFDGIIFISFRCSLSR